MLPILYGNIRLLAVGIVTGLMEKLSIEEMLERANAIGAIQVSHISDNENLPNKKHLEDFIEHFITAQKINHYFFVVFLSDFAANINRFRVSCSQIIGLTSSDTSKLAHLADHPVIIPGATKTGSGIHSILDICENFTAFRQCSCFSQTV